MKKSLIAIGALGAVLALLTASLVMGIESSTNDGDTLSTTIDDEMAYEQFDDVDYEMEYETELLDQIDEPDEMESNSTAHRFMKLVKRSYNYINGDFIGRYSNWDELPGVKTIFTANSSGKWMYNSLPRINATGEARIIDRDGDGYPELVIWKHHTRTLNVSTDVVNRTKDLISENTEDVDLSNTGMSGYSGFTLIYVDKDGDATPEMISLKVSRGFKVDINGDGRPEAAHSFHWYGATYDRDDDGDWEMQKFNDSIKTYINLNNDRNPEYMSHERANFKRIDFMGRPLWDKISAKASKGVYVDWNSDGNPSVKKNNMVSGSWLDRDGDGWPNIINIRIGASQYLDKDSDGNPEERTGMSASLRFMDRNDDKYPELVSILYRKATYIDRNSDGKVDMIKIHIRSFKWIDRNSDGIPERFVRNETTDIRYPRNDYTDPNERPEKPEKRPEDDEMDPGNERPEEPPKDGGKEPETSRPETEVKEDMEPNTNDGGSDMNGQLSSRA